MAEEVNNQAIRGEPLDLDILLDFATIDPADIESASLWWDIFATDGWQGALDIEPIDNG
jgi:hypothetical protein